MERAVVPDYELPSSLAGSLLSCHVDTFSVRAQRSWSPGEIRPEACALAVWSTVHTVVHVLKWYTFNYTAFSQEASLRILDYPVARSPVVYDIQTALYYRI